MGDGIDGMGRGELIAALAAAEAECDRLSAELARVPDRARRMLPLENMTREDLVDALKEAWQDELASHVRVEEIKDAVTNLTRQRDDLEAELTALTSPITALRQERDAAIAELQRTKAAKVASLPKVIIAEEVTVLTARKGDVADWTVDPSTGHANSSLRFLALVSEIERCIRADAHKLIAGRADATAGFILAQLAHVHGLAPTQPAASSARMRAAGGT
jgi:hypothetical protein